MSARTVQLIVGIDGVLATARDPHVAARVAVALGADVAPVTLYGAQSLAVGALFGLGPEAAQASDGGLGPIRAAIAYHAHGSRGAATLDNETD